MRHLKNWVSIVTFVGILLIAILSTPAEADSIDLNLTSWHRDKSYDYNEDNTGIGITKTINEHNEVKLGFFKNSFNKDSVYIMGRLKTQMEGWSFGINYGFVTGYDDIEPGPTPPVFMKEDDDSVYKRKHRRKSKPMPVPQPNHNIKNKDKFWLVVIPTIGLDVRELHTIELGVTPILSEMVVMLQWQHKLNL